MFGFSMSMVEGKNEVVAPALMSLWRTLGGGAMEWRNHSFSFLIPLANVWWMLKIGGPTPCISRF